MFLKRATWGNLGEKDKIGGRLLKTCADKLGPVFYNIFQKFYLYLQKNPKLWKEAIVVPVTKTHYPKGPYTPGRISARVIRQRLSTRFLCSHSSDFR